MSDIKKTTALVLDDFEEDRMLLTRFLEKLDLNVVAFADLYKAIQFSKTLTAHQDVFFLDLILSASQSGLYILANRDSKFQWLKDIKLVVISGMGDTATIIKAMELGADGYVIKPYSESLIKQKLIEEGVL